MRYVAVLAALLWFGGAQAAEPETSPPFKVGIARRAFVPAEPYDWRQDPKHALATLIWYPAAAEAQEKPKPVGPPGRAYFDIGPVAVDAPIVATPEKFPLIVLSHGFGATAANMAWLGRALAARGFITAAVNHPGNNAIDGNTVPGATLWWLRARDLSVVIDEMLKDPIFGPRIDARRIGAAGHSAGGYSVIELAGGVSSRAHFRAACAAPQTDRQCAAPPEFPDLAARVGAMTKSDLGYRAASEEVRSYRDSRVRAVFAMAPGLADAFLPDSLAHIDIPVAIVAGDADEIVPVKRNAELFAAKIPHAQLTIFPAPTGHMVFTGLCLEAGRTDLPQVCNDPPGVDRAAVEAKTADLARTFFAITAP
ncbi:MAG TPA: alpha/beta hydrolase [Stellaceae bacterium]